MAEFVRGKGVKDKLLQAVNSGMKARRKYFQVKVPPESFGADTLHSLFPQLGHVQRGLGITEKSTCYHWRCLSELSSPAAKAAAVAFLLDAGMPVVPAAFAGVDFAKLSSVTSLDFAMRIFVNDVLLGASQWLTREEQTVTGGDGRTFQEARVWDQSGRMVASISEQCMLRPKPSAGVQNAKL